MKKVDKDKIIIGAGAVSACLLAVLLMMWGAGMLSSTPKAVTEAVVPAITELEFQLANIPEDPAMADSPTADNPSVREALKDIPLFPHDRKTPLPAYQAPRFSAGDLPSGMRPMVTLIIDDMGLNTKRLEQVLKLEGTLTLSFLPYGPKLAQQVKKTRAAGDEVFLHLPMESVQASAYAGPNALTTQEDVETLKQQIAKNLDAFDGYVGVNNHMGSRFSSSAPHMQWVMEEIRRRGLLFVDSKTSDHSVGAHMAQEYGVPYAERDIFIDHVTTADFINGQLDKIEQIAFRRGYVVAIAHPKPLTLEILERRLPDMIARGIEFVPASRMIQYQVAMREIGNFKTKQLAKAQ